MYFLKKILRQEKFFSTGYNFFVGGAEQLLLFLTPATIPVIRASGHYDISWSSASSGLSACSGSA